MMVGKSWIPHHRKRVTVNTILFIFLRNKHSLTDLLINNCKTNIRLGQQLFSPQKTMTNYMEFHRVQDSCLTVLFLLPQGHFVVVQPQSLPSFRERLTSSMMCHLSLLRSMLTLLSGRSVPVLRDVIRALEPAA